MTAVAPVRAPLATGDLDALQSEGIHIIREVAGEFDRPVILFSGGKDSTLLLRLAIDAFRPAPVPFPLLHVDTGHNFAEVIEFRDRLVQEYGLRGTRNSVAAALPPTYHYDEPAQGASTR